MRYTKIVATIGPVSNTPEMLRKLDASGMDVARLNGSHNTLEWHEETIATIREVLPNTPILVDIPGRKIRTIQLAVEPSFDAGDVVILTTDVSHDGQHKVPVNYPHLHEELSPGATIRADDGTLEFTVIKVEGLDIHCQAVTAGKLRSRKGINVPDVNLKLPMVTERDREMMGFLTRNKVDYVGISFVESGEHVLAIKALRTEEWPRIVSKIENRSGMTNMKSVIAETDVIMIDRGDLSVETNLETLAVAQKKIIKCAATACKPVIVATEMLHTMIDNPFPTKAEVSDISNSVFDGCAATMLSGETAIGKFPEESVSLMARVAEVASTEMKAELLAETEHSHAEVGTHRVFGQAVALMCHSLPITKVIAVTRLGFAARVISSQNISQPILAVSDEVEAARSFNLLAGVRGIHLDVAFSKKSSDHIAECLHRLWQQGDVVDDDILLVVALTYPRSGNRMNHLQMHKVSDLIQALQW